MPLLPPQPPPPPPPPPLPPPTGGLRGLVRDATDGQPLQGATISLPNGATVLTDSRGAYEFSSLPVGPLQVSAAARDYLADTQMVLVPAGTAATANFALMPPPPPGSLRIVLTWNQAPRDLDAHFWVPSATRGPIEVNFLTRGSTARFPFAQLDLDSTTGEGPETLTITQVQVGESVYAVHNYSNERALAGSGARVQVYAGGRLQHSFGAPTLGSGRWWTVFTLNGGVLRPVNQLTATPPLPTRCHLCPLG